MLVSLAKNPAALIEARRYAVLAIGNLAATVGNHPAIVEENGLSAMFTLSNMADSTSEYYVVYALANLAANDANHKRIAKEGGLQPLIALAYNDDITVHMQAVAALRGIACTPEVRLKIIHEGGLEPLVKHLLSNDTYVLENAAGALANLALSDEAKYELYKSGTIVPLINLAQHVDPAVAQQVTARCWPVSTANAQLTPSPHTHIAGLLCLGQHVPHAGDPAAGGRRGRHSTARSRHAEPVH